MPLKQVADYVERRTGTRFLKATIYNWTNKGVRGEKLRFIVGRGGKYTDPAKGVRYTTLQWVDDFLARVSAKAGM
jgi:hypothetical protein